MLNKIAEKFFRHNGIDESDYILASFPKTGSTYTRFVFANILNEIFVGDKEVNFFNLGKILPEVGSSRLNNSLNKYPGWPRLIKTHELKELSKNYDRAKSIYIIRDPRDTMISYYNYQKKRKDKQFNGSLITFVDNPEYGMPAYNQHVDQWFSSADLIFKYEDLMTEPEKCFSQFFELEGIDFPAEILKKAIDNSSPRNVKEIEAKQSRPNHKSNFEQDFKFIRNASISQWKEAMDKELSKKIITSSNQILRSIYEVETQ